MRFRRGLAMLLGTVLAGGVVASPAHAGDGLLKRVGEQPGGVTVFLEQMERHALRRLRPDAGQATQRFDQANQ